MEKMSMDIKQQLRQYIESSENAGCGGLLGPVLCRDALAEIERLERSSVTLSVKGGDQLERIADALDRITTHMSGD
jgi:hypothetical protein